MIDICSLGISTVNLLTGVEGKERPERCPCDSPLPFSALWNLCLEPVEDEPYTLFSTKVGLNVGKVQSFSSVVQSLLVVCQAQ